jgi:hypothetical protein
MVTASAAMFALGAAGPGLAQQKESPGTTSEDLGVNNQQIVNKPAGDASIVHQHAGQGSHDNVQSTTTSSPGASRNTVVQTTEGGNNAQIAVQTGGSGNVVVQTQHGSGNRQTVTQTGDSNRAVQSQSGDNHSGTLNQRGGETDIQLQK